MRDIKIIISYKEENRDIDKQKERKRESERHEARETKQADRQKRLWINM